MINLFILVVYSISLQVLFFKIWLIKHFKVSSFSRAHSLLFPSSFTINLLLKNCIHFVQWYIGKSSIIQFNVFYNNKPYPCLFVLKLENTKLILFLVCTALSKKYEKITCHWIIIQIDDRKCIDVVLCPMRLAVQVKILMKLIYYSWIYMNRYQN